MLLLVIEKRDVQTADRSLGLANGHRAGHVARLGLW